MTDRLCDDCDEVLSLAPRDDDAPVLDVWDDELMCAICGAAMSLGGPLWGELAAREEGAAA